MEEGGSARILAGNSDHDANILYKTGFSGEWVVVVDTGTEVTLWVNSMEFDRAQAQAKPGVVVRNMSTLNPGAVQRLPGMDGDSVVLAAICQAQGVKKLTVDSLFPFINGRDLQQLGFEVNADGELYVTERSVKSADEIAQIEKAQADGLDAMGKAISILRRTTIKGDVLYYGGKQLTGQHLIDVVEKRLGELGYKADETIICGTPDNYKPHARTTDELRAHEPIVLDIFPRHKKTHLWGDMTRTVVVGTPTPEFEKMYNAVADAQAQALAMCKPGITGAEIHRKVADVLDWYKTDAAGSAKVIAGAEFTHGTGHGVGLDIHEAPNIGRRGSEPLREGMVITIEPGLYAPAFGGIRIEDTIVITKDGYRQLTHYPKDFQIA